MFICRCEVKLVVNEIEFFFGILYSFMKYDFIVVIFYVKIYKLFYVYFKFFIKNILWK